MTLVYQHLLKTTEQQRTGTPSSVILSKIFFSGDGLTMTKVTKTDSAAKPTRHRKKIKKDKREESEQESPLSMTTGKSRVREKPHGTSKRKLLLQKIKRKQKLA